MTVIGLSSSTRELTPHQYFLQDGHYKKWRHKVLKTCIMWFLSKSGLMKALCCCLSNISTNQVLVITSQGGVSLEHGSQCGHTLSHIDTKYVIFTIIWNFYIKRKINFSWWFRIKIIIFQCIGLKDNKNYLFKGIF